MKLWRPVGLAELRKIHGAEMRAFPPRLPEQPIFYPVLNRAYAEQIARDWNAESAPYAGFVTEFELEDRYAARFPRRVVGDEVHEELWVPAEELAEFNAHIVGPIAVVASYFGESFSDTLPEIPSYPA